jgi:hypothetical protein
MRTTSTINIALAATVFTLSSVTFFALDLDTEDLAEKAKILVLPLLFLGLVVLIVLLFPKRWPKQAALFTGEGSTVVWLVPLFTLLPSLFSNFEKSFQYWLLDFIILVLCRLYTVRVPLHDVLQGIFWSGVTFAAAVLIFAWELLLNAISTLTRFMPFGFHPNTIAFILATYFAVALWQIVVGPLYKKILGGFTAIVCLVVIFLASSRGSLLAALISTIVVSLMICIYEKRYRMLLMVPLVLSLAIAVFVQSSLFKDAYDLADQVLQFSGGSRGIGSGMTGRFSEWRITWALLLRGSWVYGNGVRASDGLTYPVDNGLLVLLYDMGIVPVLLIIGRFAFILWQSYHRYVTLGSDMDLVLFFLLLSFLLNNITARFLFGVGNPSSLFAVMLLASPWVSLATRGSFGKAFSRRTVLNTGAP